MSKQIDHQSVASGQPQLLQPFAGRWQTTGKVFATPEAPEMAVHGVDTYEWLPGKCFLLHRVDVMMGEEHVQSTEIFGYDVRRGIFIMHSYDEKGNIGTMHALLDNGTWTFTGPTERFRGCFSVDGIMLQGVWEINTGDNRWTPWMEIVLQKQ